MIINQFDEFPEQIMAMASIKTIVNLASIIHSMANILKHHFYNQVTC